MKPFEYLEPTSVSEGISLLAKYSGEAKVIAGGTDLLVKMKQGKESPQYVIDLKSIPGLDYINYDSEEGLRLGALVTIRALEQSTEVHQRYPAISQAASRLGHVAVRNIATLGGNLCNAVPSADMAPALVGLSARAKIVSPGGERVVPLEDFFTGPGDTVLKKGELLVEIQVPVPLLNTRGIYLKHSMRGTFDLAIVNVAVVVTLEPEDEVCKDIKIVLGAVAPTPMRAKRAEAVIKGKRIEDKVIEEAAQIASEQARPISDVRASAEYRKEMVKVFTRRAIMEVISLAA